ncbi:MAG: hypothetical protein R3E50_07070 [Halioglobus sp.]
MSVRREGMFPETVAVVPLMILAGFLAALTASLAQAQDVFSSGTAPDTGGNSGKTGTQGVTGNPFCPPPVIIIDGVPTTPRNWSCRGDEQSYRNTPQTPPDVSRPGLPAVSDAHDPCQPGGPGGYNFLNNPEGTGLPPGCVRPPDGSRQSQDYRKPPMPEEGMVSPGYESGDEGYRPAPGPAPEEGMVSPGYESGDEGYRPPPQSGPEAGMVSPGNARKDESDRIPPDQPVGQTPPDLGFSVHVYR